MGRCSLIVLSVVLLRRDFNWCLSLFGSHVFVVAVLLSSLHTQPPDRVEEKINTFLFISLLSLRTGTYYVFFRKQSLFC